MYSLFKNKLTIHIIGGLFTDPWRANACRAFCPDPTTVIMSLHSISSRSKRRYCVSFAPNTLSAAIDWAQGHAWRRGNTGQSPHISRWNPSLSNLPTNSLRADRPVMLSAYLTPTFCFRILSSFITGDIRRWLERQKTHRQCLTWHIIICVALCEIFYLVVTWSRFNTNSFAF